MSNKFSVINSVKKVSRLCEIYFKKTPKQLVVFQKKIIAGVVLKSKTIFNAIRTKILTIHKHNRVYFVQ